MSTSGRPVSVSQLWRGRRIALAVVLAGVVGVAAVLLAATAPDGTISVFAADNPRAAAQDWLRQNGGSNCSEKPIVEYYFPRLLAAADQRSSADQWLNPGSDTAFVGDFAKATFSLSGASMARGGAEAWVMGTDNAGPFIAEYSQMTTPKGRTVWVKTSWERPTAC